MAVKSMEGEVELQFLDDDSIAAVYLHAGPNPFNPQVELKFGLPKAGNVELSIFNLRGEHIARLAEGPFAAGHHYVIWEGVNSNGRKVASGMYFARLTTQNVVMTQRLVLVK